MRATITSLLFTALLVFLCAGLAQPAEAQLLKKLKDRAKDKIEDKAEKETDEAIDDVLNGDEDSDEEEAEETEQPKKKKKFKIAADEEEEDEAEEVEEAEGDGENAAEDNAAAEETAPAKKIKPGEGAWANYDFIPGERVIFAEDFTKDRVGNFPKRFEFIDGNAEVVDWEGRRWLRVNDESNFRIPLPEVLPERFTIEFEMTIPWWGMFFYSEDEKGNYNQHTFKTSGVALGCCQHGVFRGQGEGVASMDARSYFKDMFGENSLTRPFHVRMQVDGAYIKLYLDEKRVANLPNGNFGRNNFLHFFITGDAERAPLMTNISVNAGGTPMYDALMQEGRFATQGIFFDTGSDRIRPESTPTLNEIGDMLKQHADLRVLIEGHTDNVGTAESNQVLSEKRAAAVRKFLVDTFTIDESRLESKGFGATKPAATNDTAEGRQQNRRVELVKL